MSVVEIGLRQTRRGRGVHGRLFPRAKRFGGNPAGETFDARRFLTVASELLVEQQRGEPIEPRFERLLAIRFPEEARVAQASGYDALRVAGNRALVVRLGVDDGEEGVLQFAVLALDREVVLMMNQRRRQHFLGELQELRAEGACHHRGVLDEIGHFGEQPRFVPHHAADPSLKALCLGVQLASDLVVTLAPLEDHEVLEQTRAILVERADLDRASGASAGA
ncbi:MAG: hypothetical protein QM736_25495 [Vicinamibacterales bacterium]